VDRSCLLKNVAMNSFRRLSTAAVGFLVLTRGATSAGDTVVAPVVKISPVPKNDFSLAVSPASASLTPGAHVAFMVSSAVTSGAAQTISLSVSGLPSGVSGAFSPTSVSSGGSATLTLTASASAPAGAKSFTVTGTAPATSHATGGTVKVKGQRRILAPAPPK
jgi:hypothetical protein